MANNHKGACFCGAVELEVTGEPAAMGYCHCSSCRSWSAGPVNAFTLWKPENVKVTKGPVKFGSDPQSGGAYTKKLKKKGTYTIICTIHGGGDQKMKLVVD